MESEDGRRVARPPSPSQVYYTKPAPPAGRVNISIEGVSAQSRELVDELARRHGQHWEVHRFKDMSLEALPSVVDLYATLMGTLLGRAQLVRRANLSSDVPLVTERCMASDSDVLAQTLRACNLMSAKELSVHRAWSNSLGSSVPDVVVYIKGSDAPTAFAAELQRAYEDWLSVIRREGRAVMVFDAALGIEEMAKQVDQFVAQLCTAKRLSLDIMEVL